MKSFLLFCVVAVAGCNTNTECSGNSCVCTAGQSCGITCNSGGGACDVQCAPNEACNVGCTAGQPCHVECSGTTSCMVGCLNAADCHVTCPSNNCTVTNCSGAGCIVECNGANGTASGTTVTCP